MALVERLPTSTREGRLGSLESQSSASPAEVRSAPAVPNRVALDRAAVFQLFKNALRHPFSAILGKLASIGLLLLGLAAIGAYATLKGTRAHVIKRVEHTRASLAAPAGEWLVQTAKAPPTNAGNPSPPQLPAETLPARSPGRTPDGKVILNAASADDLRQLPGVGQKRAEAILSLRQKLGKFRRLTELLRVRGIGPKRLQQLLPHLVLDPLDDRAGPGATPKSGAPKAVQPMSNDPTERPPLPPATARPTAEFPDDAA